MQIFKVDRAHRENVSDTIFLTDAEPDEAERIAGRMNRYHGRDWEYRVVPDDAVPHLAPEHA